LNNNRGNNRRRGRGGNRQQGGQQTNRIDSRARGNAPQLLEKYKKLAHDSHLNGDRVQEEYYLQFADHYFRVLADQKQRQEEARQPRRDDRSPDYGDDGDDGEHDAPRSYHQQDRGYRGQGNGGGNGGGRNGGATNEASESHAEETDERQEGGSGNDRNPYEPVENPFVRDNRGVRGGLKQRTPRRGRRDEGEADGALDERDEDAGHANVDPASLPPAISATAEEKPKRRTRAKAKTDDTKADDSAEGEEKPKRRRTRKAASSSDEAGDNPVEAVN
jgi:hypothetical protein